MLGISTTLKELIALKNSIPLKNKVNHRSKNTGVRMTTIRGRGMDFDEVRNYQAGDDIRHMEWRVTARTGRPHVKVYCEEKEQSVILLVDFNSTMFFGTQHALKSIVAARLAALIAWAASKQGDKLGGLICSANQYEEHLPRLRYQGVLPFLSALVKHSNPKQNSNFSQRLSEALLRLTRIAKPGSLIVLISDFYTFDEACYQHLFRLRQHNSLMIYHVCDPLEIKAPPMGMYPITDGVNATTFNLGNTAAVQQYQRKCDQKMQALKDKWHKLAIPYTSVLTNADLVLVLHQTFPRR